MAVDKLVDSAQLESDLTDIADAIRAKTGKSASMQFPSEFVSEIGSISGGGGDDTYLRIIEGDSTITTINDSNMTKIKMRGCSSLSGLTSATFANVTTVGDRVFEGCRNLQSASFPALTTMSGYLFSGISSFRQYNMPLVTNIGTESFKGTAIQYAVFPSITQSVSNGSFDGCPNLVAADFGPLRDFTGSKSLSAPLLSTIVIRNSSRVPSLLNAATFNNSPFASGGTGGTIYIPKALYDHLGDGTNLDYKNATNWSIIDGYGTITWAQIEGSIYETQYADGTPIPTT